MSTNLIGQTLIGQYRVEAFIASGGMGEVYRVWDLKRNAWLAMKVLRADLIDEPSALKRFKMEAEALEKLAHPNIVPFYGLRSTSELVFLLQGYVEGASLKEILRERRGHPLSIPEILTIMKALCPSLGYAHATGVVHCDVKPGNVLIDGAGKIYLSDFGLARRLESTTMTRSIGGTPAYMAPEQIQGKEPDPRTDIYSLGVILFEVLTGERPFKSQYADISGTRSEKIQWEHLYQSPPSPRIFNPDISIEVDAIVLRCLEKDPPRRYPSTAALLDALLRATAPLFDGQSLPISVPRAPVERPKPSAQGRLPGWLWFVMGSTLVLLAIIFAISSPLPTLPPFAVKSIAQTTRSSQPMLAITPTPPENRKFTFAPASAWAFTPAPPKEVIYPIDACMTILMDGDANNRMIECVTTIALLPNNNLRLDFTWTAQIELQHEVEIAPDAGINHMYITDSLGNRYHHVDLGGDASRVVILKNGDSARGWFLFPAPDPQSEYFIFRDEDNNVQTRPIQKIWP
jgi:serine/threonine protein kinase